MQTQNFKNHTQYVPLYHFVLLSAMAALLGGAIINLKHASDDNFYSASLLLLAAIILPCLALFARSFALKAQDRAIRAEEQLRYFIMTGKPMDVRLKLGQIIALRFASDEEFIALAKKAADESLSSKQIKMLIKNWRGDYHRV